MKMGIWECADLVSRFRRGRDRGGVADDETGRDEKLALQLAAVSAIDLGVEGVEGSAGKVGAREADGGGGGKRVLCECDIVQADHRKILRHAEALSVGCAQNADSGHVVRADDGGGTSGELAQLFKTGDAALKGVVTFDDPFFLKLQVGGLHGGTEVVLPGDGGVKAVWAGKKGNGAVAEQCEVTNGLIHPGGVIEENGAGFGIVELEFSQDDGHAAVRELIEDRLFFSEGHNGYAVNLTLQHAARACCQHSGVAVCGTDENLVSASNGDFFEALDQLRKEGIGNVLDDDAQKAAASGDKGARVRVGQIVELLDRLPDTFAETFAYQR